MPRSKEPYPEAGDKIKYLMEGEWKKVEVTGKGGRATGKNKDYFNMKAREGWMCNVNLDKVPHASKQKDGNANKRPGKELCANLNVPVNG